MTVASFQKAGVRSVRMVRKRRVIKGVPRLAGTSTKEAFWLFEDLTTDVAEGEALIMVSRDPDRTSAAMRVWAGVLPLDAGGYQRPDRSLLASSPQSRWLRELSVEQSIRMLAGTYGLSDDDVEQVVGPAAKTAQVDSMMHWPLEDLGRGSRSQLAFAVAVNAPVPLVMFDHTALVGSPEFRPLCVEHLKALRDSGKAVVIATVKPQLVLEVGTRALIARPKRSAEVSVAEAAEFLIKDKVKGRKKARRRAHEDDDDSGLDF